MLFKKGDKLRVCLDLHADWANDKLQLNGKSATIDKFAGYFDSLFHKVFQEPGEYRRECYYILEDSGKYVWTPDNFEIFDLDEFSELLPPGV